MSALASDIERIVRDDGLARELASNDAERRYLDRRIGELG
jgi:hypothetical protein